MSRATHEIYLHIGNFKTASTSMQMALWEQRALLESQSFFFPKSMYSHHIAEKDSLIAHPLVAYLASADSFEYVQTGLPLGDYGRFCADFESSLSEELRGASGRKVLITHEGLFHMPQEKLRKLKQLLEPHAAAFKICVYLRDQREYLASWAVQILRHLELYRLSPAEFDFRYLYAPRLNDWAAVFGENSLDVRVFAKHALHKNDPVSDFFDWLVPGLELETVMANSKPLPREVQILYFAVKALSSSDPRDRNYWINELHLFLNSENVPEPDWLPKFTDEQVAAIEADNQSWGMRFLGTETPFASAMHAGVAAD